MKPITLILAVTVGVLMTSDIFHAAALRQWDRGNAAEGMRLIRTASRVNPLAFNVRLDQIESLYSGWRSTRNPDFLREIVLLARGLTLDYPGNIQAQGVYASALIYRMTHGDTDLVQFSPMPEAMQAIERDPLSVTAIERAMFLLAVKRVDYDTFKDLGIKRSRLTTDRLTMKCELCGRPWLEHRP